MFFVSTLTVNGLFSICLTIQPILRSLSSELVVAYMDDVTLRGTKSTAADDITTRQGVERLKLISAHDALVLLKNSPFTKRSKVTPYTPLGVLCRSRSNKTDSN